MMDHSNSYLYRRIISPTLNVNNSNPNGWQHYRHSNLTPTYSVKIRSRAGSPDCRRGRTPQPHLKQVPCSELVNGDIASQRSSPVSCGNYNFQPTTAFKATSLPAMPLSRMYLPSPNGTIRSIPITVGHQKPVIPYSRSSMSDNPRLTSSSQQERLASEEQAKEQCRKLKRTSEIRSHRVDQGYYISGLQLPIKYRYHVDPDDLLRLRYLARQQRSDGQQTITDYQSFSIDNMRESPGGQLSSPVPSQRPASSAAFSNGTDHGEASSQDGKWAQGAESDSSSVFDENDLDSLRKSLKEKGRLQTLHKASEAPADCKPSVDSHPALSVDQERPVESGEEEKNGNETDGSKDDAVEILQKDERTNQSKSTKKSPKIRFHDGPRLNGPRMGEKGQVGKEQNKKEKEKEKKNGKKDNGEEQAEKKPNRYMDEWLGIKPKPVDERYKPGKPKPNRIFLSPEIRKKEKKPEKFSKMILTELEVREDSDIEDDYLILNPDKKYCFLNEKQKVAFGSIFDEIDKDKNGYVTLEELKLRMVPAVSKSDIKHFIQVFDINKDQTVDKREFTAICALNDKLSGISTEAEDSSLALNLERLAKRIVMYKEMYKTIDRDDDGRLDADEVMIMVATAMATELGADLELARKVVNGARDEYGYIDFIGFLLYMPFFAKLYKAIMAKPLTIEELEKAKEKVRQKEISFKPKVERAKKEPKSWEVF